MIPLTITANHINLNSENNIKESLKDLLFSICHTLINQDEDYMSENTSTPNMKKLIKIINSGQFKHKALELSHNITTYSKLLFNTSSLDFFKKPIKNLLAHLNNISISKLLDIVYNTILYQSLNFKTSNSKLKPVFDLIRIDAYKFSPYIRPKLASPYKYTLVLDLDETLVHSEVCLSFNTLVYIFNVYQQRLRKLLHG
jgi:hypothetical protein